MFYTATNKPLQYDKKKFNFCVHSIFQILSLIFVRAVIILFKKLNYLKFLKIFFVQCRARGGARFPNICGQREWVGKKTARPLRGILQKFSHHQNVFAGKKHFPM
jgi:hypothetical protein